MSNISSQLNDFIGTKSIAILGFGREGQSTYKFLRSYFPQKSLCIADANETISEHGLLKCDDNISFELGEEFLLNIRDYDLVFKSPGISFKNYERPHNQIISSQTDLFLHLFSNQTIGVSGTKGKSTTVSMLQFVLKEMGKDVLLIGNIGIPALDVVYKIKEKSIIVYELSSHQLEFVHNSPHISILLNLYQEHLDHYNSYLDYRNAKWNIVKYQSDNDYFIFCADEPQLIDDLNSKAVFSNKLSYSLHDDADIVFKNNILKLNNNSIIKFDRSKLKLLGSHNVYNLMAVILVAESLKLDIEQLMSSVYSFNGLEHRLEFVDKKQGVKFYNDSIATIPQACIKAIESVDDVDTLILGGFDRGIDYSPLIVYLYAFRPLNLILIGAVGERIATELHIGNYKGVLIQVDSYEQVVAKAIEYTDKGKSCLLSPAASSYDMFKNFEERGNKFKQLVSKIQ